MPNNRKPEDYKATREAVKQEQKQQQEQKQDAGKADKGDKKGS